jgi:thioredoxin-dependent peroxiredoxin
MLKEGQKAPQFALKDQNGKIHKLTDYKGKKIVLYFYPKDDTPGCTKEACSFRDVYSAIKKKGAIVLGISADDMTSHAKFAKKYSLPFPLLSDPEKTIIKEYNAWGEKNFYGKVFFGITRSTFIIDEKSNIKKIFLKVKPEDHADEVLDAL